MVAAEDPMDNPLTNLAPLAVLFVAMYFLMIRPQQKRQRATRAMLAELSKGDDVVTIGGLHGRVYAVADDHVDLQVTDDVVLRFQRSAIARKVSYDEESASKAVKAK
jgi:preprotein translocase subunit YajC